MTGYQSKKASAQDKLTQWLEALHHSQEPESVDAQPDDPTGQAPCVRHCEATAFQIVIRGLKGDIERLKAAQRTEPVGCVADIDRLQRQMFLDLGYSLSDPLYTTPPAHHKQATKREWVDLTEQEALDCFSPNPVTHSKNVEAKLKEKNT